MSELRYNILSRDWVIIAAERARRPEDFKAKKKPSEPRPERRADCPFCPGNEGDGKDETFRLPDAKAWKTRSVYNKYPALSPMGDVTRTAEGIYNHISGYGVCEVIIEHPRHDIMMALMTDEDVLNVLKTYKSRYVSVSQNDNVKAITIFKNHGPAAGCSLEHPHSQLVATPIVPPQVRNRMEQAARYFDSTGKCVFCHSLEQEIHAGERVVLETDHFVSFVPYAAPTPFLISLFPRRHATSFDEISEEEMKDMARHLKSVLRRLYSGLDNPDFNLTIRSIPVKEKGVEYFHWYVSIIPRISQPAGFEVGTGIFINTSPPEQGAEFLRGIKQE